MKQNQGFNRVLTSIADGQDINLFMECKNKAYSGFLFFAIDELAITKPQHFMH